MEFCRRKSGLGVGMKSLSLLFAGVVVLSCTVALLQVPSAEGADETSQIELMANAISNILNEEWIIDKEGAEKKCEVKNYVINSPQDLIDNIEDLECIFWAGKTPAEVPIGNVACHSLTTKHSTRLSKVLDNLWQGHVFTQTKCDKGTIKHFDQPTLQLGIKPSVGLVTLGRLDVNLDKGEHSEPKDLLLMDYRIDFKEECPPEGNDFPGWMGLSTEAFAPYFPFNPPGAGIFYDAATVVGRDPTDGSIILLEKYYTNAPQGYVTIGFLYQRNYDKKLMAQFPAAIPLTTSEFSYTEVPGVTIFKDMLASVPGDFISLPVPNTK